MIIENRIAVITGAGKGIGEAIAYGLSEMSYQTVLIGRNPKNLEKVAAEIVNNGGLAPVIFLLDVTDTPKMKETIQSVIAQFGRIDVLVNNAGVYFDGTLELEESEFQAMLNTNLTAQFTLTKEVVPWMEHQRSGYIFNIASRSGKVGYAGSGGYCASKFGMLGLNESLYHELTPKGIKVTALCPGWVNTQMAFDAGTPLKAEEMIQPEDLFKTIRYLLQLSPTAIVKEVVIEAPSGIR
ncbi:SDR family oxidoreductase [Maribellus sp. CM-23]|uniref:SDR family oxidoreductase n=1 Tax=Maribellus sp. CM-23 TaxID=2781026 RepID=UPI001F2AC0AC|nr:SDR family oxidoreductase [Maribellus sp. CM-23]MCE4566103.1 SDR family oxidoreductase [Maribellus sp. CM-23]